MSNAVYGILILGGGALLAYAKTKHADKALPANTPLPFANQAWQAAMNNALQNQAPGPEVMYTTRNALIESRLVASEHRTDGKIRAAVLPSAEVRVSVINTFSAWSTVTEPVPPSGVAV